MSTQTIGRAEFVSLGADMRGYYAVPATEGPHPGILVFQEAFGVNDYIQSEVRRLASAGYAAIAPDLFHGKTLGHDDMGPVFAALQALTDDAMVAEVRAAAAFLDAQPEVGDAPYGAIGFCMGGRLAVLTAIELGAAIGAAVSFYGGNIAPDQQRLWSPLGERIAGASAAILMVYGAGDESIAPAEIGRVAQALAARKGRFAISVYPDAGHGFASNGRPQYNPEAAESAWDEALAFFGRYLGGD
jgi:carboxymethylenebutenolidase